MVKREVEREGGWWRDEGKGIRRDNTSTHQNILDPPLETDEL